MAVFPTSADFNRRTPRPSESVASYRTGRAAEIGMESAQTQNEQGRQTQATGEMLLGLGEQLDVAAAQEAVTQLRAKRQEMTIDPEKGFKRLKGGEVMQPGPGGKPLLDELPTGLQSEADAISGKLLSPRAKALFRQAASSETLGFKRDLLTHMDAQTEVFKAQAYKNAQVGFQNRAAQSIDPAEIEAFADQAYRSTIARAKMMGIEGDEMARGAQSDVLLTALQRRIQAGDESAIGMFERWKGKLDAKDLVSVEQSIKTMRVSVTARGQAQSLTDSTYDGRTRSYESGAMEFNKLGSGAFGPYQFMPSTWSDVRAKNPDLNLPADMTTATREQHDAAHQRFKAENANSLRGAGIDPTPANLYLAHRFGVEGAASVIKAAPNTPLSSVLPAKWQEQNPDMRGQTAGSFRALAERRYAGVTDTGIKVDPLRAGVDAATGVQPPKSGPQYVDTRQMLLDADASYEAATRRNMEVNATDEAQRRATQSQLDLNLAGKKRQIEMVKLQLDMSVDKWMQTGGPNGTAATSRPPPEIWNQLHYEKQKSIDATIAHNAKGTDAVTDQQVWYQIQQGLSSEDAAVRGEWANKPLWEFKSKLSNQDFQELAKMQATAKKGDPEKNLTHVRNINQLVDDTLLRMKVDTTPKPGSTDAERAGKFRRSVQERITAFEAEKGKKATPEEQQKIIDSLAIEVRGTGGWFTSNKRRYDMKVGDVPQAERDKIVDALKRAGHTATDDMIIDLFARKNAVPAR